jgi:hypothetical protein
MLFGDLIEQLLLGRSDLPLLAELRALAEANDLDLGTYTAAAVNRYASEASAEEWVSLNGAIGRAPDFGVAYLRRALVYATRQAS